VTDIQLQRPMRADARRNYDKLLAAARELFAAEGTSVALEEIAERAGVGIGTLYRHFPTRQALLEAVFQEEVEGMARAAAELSDLSPWEALSQWYHQYLGFAATKKALNEALLEEAPDSNALLACKTILTEAGSGLIERAEAAGAIRPGITYSDVARLVGGIAMVPTLDDGQRERLLDLALDGLRYRP
jgi:AcrR family transcriptional regulator